MSNCIHKPHHIPALKSIAVFGFAIISSLGVLPAQMLVNYNFNSLSNGNLVGQGGWTLGGSGGSASPSVTAGPGIDTTQVATASTASSGLAVAQLAQFSAGSLTYSNTNVTLTFYLQATSASSTMLFGLGSATNNGPSFGISSGVFSIRGDAYSTSTSAVNSSNVAVSATLNDWYSVKSVWNLTSNEFGSQLGAGTLYIQDLTAGAVSYTQLFFNQAQTQATANLNDNGGGSAGPQTWTSAYLRTGLVGTGGYADNLIAAVVPEPKAGLLLGFGLLLTGTVSIFKRRNSSAWGFVRR